MEKVKNITKRIIKMDVFLMRTYMKEKDKMKIIKLSETQLRNEIIDRDHWFHDGYCEEI